MESTESKGWVGISERAEKGEKVKVEAEYDMVFCATGRKVPVEGFERSSQDRMAIAITANWTNYGTPEEVQDSITQIVPVTGKTNPKSIKFRCISKIKNNG